jgi:hypothetical protein
MAMVSVMVLVVSVAVVFVASMSLLYALSSLRATVLYTNRASYRFGK